MFLNITNFYCSGNLNLFCIQICTSSDTSNWASLDSQMYYSLDCNYTSVDQVIFKKDNLISIIDIYGREVNQNYKGVLFYIYKNGKVEKQITLGK